MKDNVHIIQKQRYEIKCRQQKVAMDFQNRIDDINTRNLLPAISSVLDKYFPADQMTIIDNIELDLGRINANMENNEWTEKIFEKLHEYLSNEVLLNHNQNGNRNIHVVNAWIWFLKYGMLPAECIYDSVTELVNELRSINESDKYLLRSFLVNESDNDILKRLVANTNDEAKKLHLQLFFSESIERLLIEIDDATSRGRLDLPTANFSSDQIIWKQVFKRLSHIKKEGVITLNEFITEIKESIQIHRDNDSMVFGINEGNSTLSLKEPGKADKSILPISEIFVSNAGLCLLAPWINSFFKQLKLTEGNEFIEIMNQEHAVFLLHYLITGDEYPTEEVLTFPKLLCGWPLQMPVINSIVITESEKNECNDLLTSMIQNWEALKSTSIAGLRESFLQRGGKLVEKDEQFLLLPEQQSIDLLLEYVPWTFRFIRLPWMKKAVHVEWY